MDIIIRVAIAGIVGSVLSLVLRRGAPEIGLILAVAASLLILIVGMELTSTILSFARVLQNAASLSPALITPVFQTVGIGILTKLSADVCRDAGQGAIAGAVELSGTVAAIYIALPLMQAVFEMIGRLL